MATELSVHSVHQGGLRVLARAGAYDLQTDYPMPGGEPPTGPTSLQLLLASLATCSANGVAALLRRDGVVPASLEVTATGQRRDTHPTVLESIHLAFDVAGTGLDAQAMEHVLETAETRICPVWVMLSAGTPITRSLTLR